MTIHAPVSHANRRALPRALIARRLQQHAHAFKFEIGNFVRLTATGQSALIVSRTQTADCEDEYAVELTGGGNAPLTVGEWEIERAPARRTYRIRWKFRVGQSVYFYDVPGTVLSRQSSAKGRQLYNIRIDVTEVERPFRSVFGDALTVRDINSSTAEALEIA